MSHKILLVGSSGSIGKVVYNTLEIEGYDIWTCDRSIKTLKSKKCINLNDMKNCGNDLDILPSFDGIIWAQGANIRDNIRDFNIKDHLDIYHANLVNIISGLQSLLKFNKINNNSSICIISSIWQELSKKNKLSYTISKSGIKGLVHSLIADLSPQNIRVNAVLPGPIDTPMTHVNLSKAELNDVISSSPYKRLPQANDVANTISWLMSKKSNGVTGNFIKIDEGASSVKTY